MKHEKDVLPVKKYVDEIFWELDRKHGTEFVTLKQPKKMAARKGIEY